MDYHPRKRPPAYNSSPTSAALTIKRPRPSLDIDSLTDQQRRTIAEAAAILKVPVRDLAALRSSSARSSAISQGPRQRLPYKMGVSKEHKKHLYSLPRSDSSSDDWERGVEEVRTVAKPPDAASSLCGLDSYFNFPKNTSMWSDCFANLAPHEMSLSQSNGYTGGSLSNAGTQFHLASASTEPSLSTQLPSFQIDQPLGHIVPVMNEPISNNDFYACDFPYPSTLLRSYPSLTPDSKEMLQPLPHKQEMIYPDMSLGPASWVPKIESNGQHFETINEPAGLHLYGDAGFISDEMQDQAAATDTEKPGGPRRGPFRNLHDRAQTAQTRRLTACVRCRMQRIRCIPDPYEPHGVCLTCKKVSNMKLSKLPCLRYKITEIKLFKPGQVPGMEWTLRWSNNTIDDISIWASQQSRRIQVTEGYCADPLELEVNQFVAVDGDTLHRKWVAGGVKKQALIPPYAIVDLAAAEQAFRDYINRGGAEFFKSVLDHKDKLLWDTYSVAIERANDYETPEQERILLKMVLRLWVAIRITTRSIRIAGEETLGMPKDILDETSPLHGSIPIPPVMGAQIELILIQRIQVPLRVKVLDLLQKVIQANKPETWLTIYLCIFILLHNCAMITKHDAGYARKHGIQARFARPAMVAEYHMGANILLAYFHYCNKGLLPFALGDDGEEIASLADLNDRQTRFIHKTRDYVKANESRFDELKWQCAFENDHYFVAQLFEAEWKPRSTL